MKSLFQKSVSKMIAELTEKHGIQTFFDTTQQIKALVFL